MPSDREISLAQGYLWMVGMLEAIAKTPLDQALGLIPGGHCPSGYPPRILASGPEYIARNTTVAAPGRRGSLPPARVEGPKVPHLPDRDQIAKMLTDDRNAIGLTTEAEKRACLAHLRLMDALASARIRASADCYLDNGDAYVTQGGRCPVDPSFWSQCEIDYGDSSAASLEANWKMAGLDSYVRSGWLSLGSISLDLPSLEREVLDFDSQAGGSNSTFQEALPDAEIDIVRLPAAGKTGQWTVTSSGNSYLVTLKGEKNIRGMRALDVLLRNRGRRVSNFLLDGLCRKPGHTSLKKTGPNAATAAPEIDRRDRLQAVIDPISDDLLEGRLSVREAHDRLSALPELLKHKYLRHYLAELEGKDAIPLCSKTLDLDDVRVKKSVKHGIYLAMNHLRSLRIQNVDVALITRTDGYSHWLDGRPTLHGRS